MVDPCDKVELVRLAFSLVRLGAGKGNGIAHCRANRGLQVSGHVRLSDNLLDE